MSVPPKPAGPEPRWALPKLDPGHLVRQFVGMDKGPLLHRRVSPLRLIAVSFLVAILVGTIVLMLPASRAEGARPLTLGEAMFTATSATTVTGLVVRDTATTFSPLGIIAILLLIQFGGLGYMTTMAFLFLFRSHMPIGPGMLLQEQLGLPTLQDILKFARRVFGAVILLEGIGTMLLFLAVRTEQGTGGLFWSAFHAISAFNNAGFDLAGDFRSLIPFATNPLVNATVMLLVIFGGLGFLTLNELYDRIWKRKRLSLHSRVVLWSTAILILGGAAVFFVLERGNALTLGRFDTGTAVMASLFHSVIARTAGFSTIPLAGLGVSAAVLLLVLMFIGGAPTGTAGGVKTTTFSLAVASALAGLKGKEDVELGGRRLSHRLVFRAFAIIFLAIAGIFAGTLIMSAFDNYPLYMLLFEATSAFSTVGLSAGITPSLSTASHIVLMFLMYIGRLGPLGLAAAFIRTRTPPQIKLPEDAISL